MQRSKILAFSAAASVAGATGIALAGGGIGPNVIYTDCTSVSNWGSLLGIQAYSLGSHTCNIGDQNLLWGSANNGTPVLGMNAYRLHDGRLIQIGMSWAKNGTGAAAGNGCGLSCNGQGGSVLGVGCRDIYSSGFNGFQGILQPRSQINAYTGAMPPAPGGGGTIIERRLQIHQSDLDTVKFADALFFIEGVYVGTDDAQSRNWGDNASYKHVTIDPIDLDMTPQGTMSIGDSAIYAWRDHGNGLNTPDPDVGIEVVRLDGVGTYNVGWKVTDNGNGTWHYEYAVFNLNSYRSGSSLRVNIPVGVEVTGVTFHDVDYHSGEAYDNTDWTATIGSSMILWESPETFEQNPNSNALRWGTMYNFGYDATAGPVQGGAALGLFVPAPDSPSSILIHDLPVPDGGVDCPFDCGDGDGLVGISDVLAVLDQWGGPGSCDVVGDDGVNIGDLLAILAVWGPCP